MGRFLIGGNLQHDDTGWYGMMLVQAMLAYYHEHQHKIDSRCYNALVQPKRGPWGSPAHFLCFDPNEKVAILSVRGAVEELVSFGLPEQKCNFEMLWGHEVNSGGLKPFWFRTPHWLQEQRRLRMPWQMLGISFWSVSWSDGIFVACLWCFAGGELFLCIFVGLQQECDLISGFGWRHWTKRPWRWQETVSRQVQCLVIWSFSFLFPSFRSVFQLLNQFWSGLHMQVSWRLQILCCRASDLLSGQRPTNVQLVESREGGKRASSSLAPQGSASSLGIFLIGYWSQFGSQYCMPGDSFVVRWDDEVVTKRQLWYSVGVGSNPWIHGIFKRIFLVKNCGKAKEFTTLISSVCCLCTLPMCLVYELWDLTIGCRCSLHRFKGCSCCFGSQLYHREFLRHGCSLCSWVCWRSFQVSHSESLNWTSTVHFFWIGSYAIDYRCDGEFNCTANIK